MNTSSKIRTNAIALIEENYQQSDKSISLYEYAKEISESDPTFYCWLFQEADNINDFGSGMTQDQKDEAEKFIESINAY